MSKERQPLVRSLVISIAIGTVLAASLGVAALVAGIAIYGGNEGSPGGTGELPTLEWVGEQGNEGVAVSGLAGTRSLGETTLRITGLSPEQLSELTMSVTGPAGDAGALSPGFLAPSDSPDEYSFPYGASFPTAPGTLAGEFVVSTPTGSLGASLPVTVTAETPPAGTVPTSVAYSTPERQVNTPTHGRVVVDEVLVGVSFDTPNPDGVALRLASQYGGTVYGSIPATLTYQIRFPTTSVEETLAIERAIRSDLEVESATLNVFSQSNSEVYAPNDREWNHEGDTWSVTPGGRNWFLEDVGVPQVWARSAGRGKGVKIAVVDYGFSIGHEDTAPNTLYVDPDGFDYVNPSWKLTYDDSDFFHGTMVAGTACAAGDNSVGVTGVAFNCDLLVFATDKSIASIENSIAKAVNQEGARIVNTSLGVSGPMCGGDMFQEAFEGYSDWFSRINNSLRVSRQKDFLWVTSAGNDSCDAAGATPGNLAPKSPNIVSVASTGTPDNNAELAEYSNFGDRTVTLSAPGEVYTTYRSDVIGCWGPLRAANTKLKCGDYGTLQGTSFSSPIVAGIAALMLGENPNLSAAQMKVCLSESAKGTGRFVERGVGRVWAPAALAECSPQNAPEIRNTSVDDILNVAYNVPACEKEGTYPVRNGSYANVTQTLDDPITGRPISVWGDFLTVWGMQTPAPGMEGKDAPGASGQPLVALGSLGGSGGEKGVAFVRSHCGAPSSYYDYLVVFSGNEMIASGGLQSLIAQTGDQNTFYGWGRANPISVTIVNGAIEIAATNLRGDYTTSTVQLDGSGRSLERIG